MRKKKKQIKKDNNEMFKACSRASSDLNEFHYDGMKEDQESTILTGKREEQL